MELRFLKTDSLIELAKAIPNNLSRYRIDGFDDLDLYSTRNSFSSSNGKVNLQELETLLPPDSEGFHEVENSLKVFNAFPNLSRYEATDPRLWTLYCHMYGLEYTRSRYKYLFESTDISVQEVQKHFFANNTSRDLLRNNSLARLWWNCRIAFDVDLKIGHEILEVLLVNTDFRATHVERPSQFGSNAFKALLLFAYEKYKSNPRDLYFTAPRAQKELAQCTHYNYRTAAKFLNRIGGWVNLSALDVNDIVKMIKNDEEEFSI